MAEGKRRLVVEIAGDASKLSSVFDDAGKQADGFGTKVKQGVMLGVGAIVGLGVASLSAAAEFNKGMANVASLIPGNTERVKELGKSVQGLAIETGQSTTDMSAALYQVVSAFGDSADAAEILRINARAAVAGVATTSEAIAITSAVTKSYGDTSKKAVKDVADLATLTVRLGQTTFPELASSIGAVTPLARSAGVSQKELFAVMATGAGVTGSASEVATQFKAALQGILAPTKDASSAFKAYRDDVNTAGFASGEAAVKALGVQGALKVLTDAATSSGEPLQKYISSIEGQTLALTLVGGQAENYTKNLAQMADASGATDKAFAEQTTGVNKLGFMWDQVKQVSTVAMQVIGNKIGDWLLPKLKELGDWWAVNGEDIKTRANDMKDALVDAFNKMVDAAKAFFDFLVENKPVLVGFGTLAGVVLAAQLTIYAKALYAAALAEWALLAPLLAIGVPLAILIGTLTWVADRFGQVQAYVLLAAAALAMLAAVIVGAPLWAMLTIGAAVGALGAGLLWVWEKIGGFGGALSWLGDVAGSALGSIGDAIGWLVDKVARVGGSMFGPIADGFRAAINFVIRGWNRLHFTMPSFEAFGKKIGGMTIGVSPIATLHTGGTFLASTPGGEGLALLRDREQVIPPRSGLAGAGTQPTTVTNNQYVTVDATGMTPDAVIELIRKFERQNGASWRASVA